MFKITFFKIFLVEPCLKKMDSQGASTSKNSTAWVEYLLLIIFILYTDFLAIVAARELQRQFVHLQTCH